MPEISLSILLYDKNYLELFLGVLTKQNLQIPVFIVEFPDYFSIDYTDDYEQPEIYDQFASHFSDHQLYDTLEITDKDMIMEITSTTTPDILDDWGRGLSQEQSIITHYLIKRRIEAELPIPKTKYHVLFGDELKEYQIYIYKQSQKSDGKPFYIVAKGMVKDGQQPELLPHKFSSVNEAFWSGYNFKQREVEADFLKYQQDLKKLKRAQKKK